jgi:hypothetical protein
VYFDSRCKNSGGTKIRRLPVAPPRVDHLDVVGRLTPSMKWKPRIHNAPLTCEPGGLASNETCAQALIYGANMPCSRDGRGETLVMIETGAYRLQFRS